MNAKKHAGYILKRANKDGYFNGDTWAPLIGLPIVYSTSDAARIGTQQLEGQFKERVVAVPVQTAVRGCISTHEACAPSQYGLFPESAEETP